VVFQALAEICRGVELSMNSSIWTPIIVTTINVSNPSKLSWFKMDSDSQFDSDISMEKADVTIQPHINGGHSHLRDEVSDHDSFEDESSKQSYNEVSVSNQKSYSSDDDSDVRSRKKSRAEEELDIYADPELYGLRRSGRARGESFVV
jgi:hypothetical protein